MTDPWQHRSQNMKCKTCMWFVPKKITVGPRPDHHVSDKVSDLGRCRKRAPTLQGYPAVYVNDWCGDHKIDETKIIAE